MLSSVCKAHWYCMYHHAWPLEIQFYTYAVYCVFCIDHTTNCDYLPTQHWLIGFYNLQGVWLLRVTDWMCKYNSGEARVRSHVCTCEICGGEIGTGTGFSHSNSVFSCQYHSANAPYLIIFISMLLLSEGKRGGARKSSKNRCFFGIGERWIERCFHFLCTEWIWLINRESVTVPRTRQDRNVRSVSGEWR